MKAKLLKKVRSEIKIYVSNELSYIKNESNGECSFYDSSDKRSLMSDYRSKIIKKACSKQIKFL
tara:strand:- start:213 stop:404 length:192 start_codon:yes stop_codon:yes gene_type:complete